MGTKVAAKIAEKGYKKGWVAEKAGITRSTLSLIVSGKSYPSLRVALKLAKILDTTVEELWGHLIDGQTLDR